MKLLHSNILGTGEPLLILHGFLGMSDNWKTLGSKYADNGFEVHMIDQRNHGKSFQSDDFSYELMTADLYEYCLSKGLKKVNIIGHSMGGKTAMFFATQHPEMVNKMIIADIGPKHYPQHHQTILEGLNSLDFGSIDSRQEADNRLSAYIKDFGIRQFLLKNLYWKSKGELAFRFNLEALTAKIENIGIALPSDQIYSGSTLFLKGERSDYILQKDEAEIKKQFPNSVIGVIKNAGHWLHAENPAMFFDISLAYLSEF